MKTLLQFNPWVGDKYNGGFMNHKVLVLGESHYCNSPSDANPNITQEVIESLFDPDAEFEGYMNTFTKFAKAMTGLEELSKEDKREFWNSVAFYNFVQFPINQNRMAPSLDNFRESEPYFFEVLEELKPDVVIAWGDRLYNNLPKGGFQGDDVQAPDGRWIETWNYVLENGSKVVVLPITHPSAAFVPSYWHSVLQYITRV